MRLEVLGIYARIRVPNQGNGARAPIFHGYSQKKQGEMLKAEYNLNTLY